MLLAFLLFGNTLWNDYAWDDKIAITSNERVQSGLRGISELWKRHDRNELQDYSGYRPVTLTTFAMDQAIAGNRPWFGHLGNIILYGLCCSLLFLFLKDFFDDRNQTFAGICTLLFLVHPAHCEVVANVKSRDEILAMIFMMLALLLTIRMQREVNENGRISPFQILFISFLCFLAMLSRESSVVIFALMPLVVLFKMNKRNWKSWFLAGTGPALFILSSLGISLISGSFPWDSPSFTMGAVQEHAILGNCLEAEIGIWDRIGMAARLLVHYEKIFLVPYPLVYYSGFNQFEVNTWLSAFPNVFYFLPHVFAAGLLIYVTVLRKWRELVFGFAWFSISIALYLQILFLLDDTFADRFMFVASAGLSVLLCGLISRAFRMKFIQDKNPDVAKIPVRAKLFYVLVISICAAWGTLTFCRNRIWKDDLSLFSHDIHHLENCSRAHYYLAEELFRRNPEPPFESVTARQIELHYRRAIEISDEAYYARTGLTEFLIRSGKSHDAAEIAKETAAKFSEHAEPWFFLGKVLYLSDDVAGAKEALHQSHLRNPRPEDMNYYYIKSMLESGDTTGAFVISGYAVKLHAKSPAIQEARADVFFAQGQYEFALLHMEESVNLNAGNEAAWKKLIGMCQASGNQEMAEHFYRQARDSGVLR